MSLPELVRTLDEVDRDDAGRLHDLGEVVRGASASKWGRRAESTFNGLMKRLNRAARGGRRKTCAIDVSSLMEELGVAEVTHG